jgi:hypothetical protein
VSFAALAITRAARVTLLLASLLAAASPTFAATDAAPSPERLRRLSAALDSATFVRVVARRGTFDTRRALVDTTGVHVLRNPGRVALVVVGDANSSARDQRLLRWSEIERIQAGRGHSATPALVGLGIGAAALGGAAIFGRDGGPLEPEAAMSLWFGAILVAGVSAVAGFTLVASTPPMHAVYP